MSACRSTVAGLVLYTKVLGSAWQLSHKLQLTLVTKMMTFRNGVCEFKSLAKAVELDTDWFRSVTSLLPKFAGSSPNGSIVPFVTPYSDAGSNSSVSDSIYPCSLCGMVTDSRSKHVLNNCERLKEKYKWRKENIIHYIDSLLDHNSFKVFCNLKDRRTATGKTFMVIAFSNINVKDFHV